MRVLEALEEVLMWWVLWVLNGDEGTCGVLFCFAVYGGCNVVGL